LMSLVSLVAVTSFQSIGSILVIAFMIIPAMTAALWTRTLSGRLVLSCLLGTAGAVLGIIGAIASDSSLAGMMAAVLGVFFIVSLIFAPATGILAAFRQRKKQRFTFGRETLLQHLLFHAGTEEEARENALFTLSVHMKWPENFTRKICRSLLKDGYITERNGLLLPTEQGKAHNLFYRENVRA
ncbi:metal ABC transporter permease, partial [Dialister invisus]